MSSAVLYALLTVLLFLGAPLLIGALIAFGMGGDRG